MKDYIFINENLVNKFFYQLPDNEKTRVKQEITVSVSMTGPKGDLKTSEVELQDIYARTNAVEKAISSRNMMANFRPCQLDIACENYPYYFKESFEAVKVHIPIPDDFFVKGLEYLIVWVSEPNPDEYVDDGINQVGAFLYLVEIPVDLPAFNTVISGCSALQSLYNLSNGKGMFDRAESCGEPLGRWNYTHPLKKLESIGGTIICRKNITSMYKMRYFTNEQSYQYNGQNRRVNDILAYPLYIIENECLANVPSKAFGTFGIE